MISIRLILFYSLLSRAVMEKEVFIEGIGMVTFRQSPKARHYSLKISKGKVLAVMPVGGNEALMRRFINENRARIETALVKHPERPPLDESTDLRATTFRVRICRSERKDFRMRLQDEVLSVECPSETCFSDTKVQELLRSMIERALRHEAKRLLPDRLSGLAGHYGFCFNEVKINNSKSHWGSCTSRKNINLSLSLMLLPWHLVDYVLLHELCHTVEMSHNDRFWALMDKVTDGRALALRRELKGYHMLG